MAKKDKPVDLSTLAQAQQTALARLHLKLTGDTHALLLDLLDKLTLKLTAHADEAGVINPMAANLLTDFTAIAWREFFSAYERRFQAARRQAALLSFAALPYYHNHFMNKAKAEAYRSPHALLTEADPPHVDVMAQAFYDPQLQDVLDAAANRVYSDGFKLSQRIWNLDQAGLAGLRQIITETIATGDSAWDAAKRLEAHLGAGQECPRWTSTRLYKLTKTDIAAGNTTGLIKGNPCLSKGVAYNALRLARNETQIVHAAATDEILKRQPWVQAEKVNLSPSHPPIDCDCPGVATGGEKGDGVYPVGTIKLPVHCQCLCHKTAVMMGEDDFIKQMRGWVNGTEKWAAMDDYSTWLGATRSTLTTVMTVGSVLYQQLVLPLERWLSSSEDELNAALEGGDSQ
jgi:hypothetical protein